MERDWIVHHDVQKYDDIVDDLHTSTDFINKPKYFCNTHTHGLYKHNKPEICICIDIGYELIEYTLNTVADIITINDIRLYDGLCMYIECIGKTISFSSSEKANLFYIILSDDIGIFPISAPNTVQQKCQYPYNMQFEYRKLIEDNIIIEHYQ